MPARPRRRGHVIWPPIGCVPTHTHTPGNRDMRAVAGSVERLAVWSARGMLRGFPSSSEVLAEEPSKGGWAAAPVLGDDVRTRHPEDVAQDQRGHHGVVERPEHRN